MSRAARPIDRSFVAVSACFVLSGFAALLYQTVWMREFSILFGTSELAIATVLAAYMAGLAAGAAVSGRFVDRITRPVLFYGLLELGVAVGALLVPLGLSLVLELQGLLLGVQPELADSGGLGSSVFFLMAGFVVVALPTAFMGATLPVLTRHVVHNTQQIGRRTGLLYALNTLGAVLGTLSCAFWILPALGLFATTLVGVGINALIFLIAIRLQPPGASARPASTTPAPTRTATLSAWRGPGLILPLILVSGAVSFGYEVLWTRLLAHIVGTSLYAFATMLATFLIGITVGSAIAARFARDARRSALGFAVAQVGTALSALFVFAALDDVPGFAARLSAGESAGLIPNALAAAAVLFPTALFIGASFPFAVRVLARDSHEAAPASARVYAWNTVGAIAGATLAGFVIVPQLEFTGSVLLAVTLNLLLGVAAAALVAGAGVRVWAGVALGGGLAVLLLFPSRPGELLLMSPIKSGKLDGEILYSSVGQSSTVLLLDDRGGFKLYNSGLPEAQISPRGIPPRDVAAAWWLGAFPPLAHPDARSMLVIGLGGGVVLEGIPSTIEEIDVIELEPKVITANQLVAERRRADPLADPRVRLILNDARGALRLTDKRWDIIVSQPSHPWTAGASHLYSREFMEQIQRHLKPGGVFCQGYLDDSILGVLGATLGEVFSEVRLYNPSLYLYLAADRPIDVISAATRSEEVLERERRHYAELGVHSRAELAAMLVLDPSGVEAFARDATVVTDDRNWLATAPPIHVSTTAGTSERNPGLDAADPYQRPGPGNLLTGLQLPPLSVARRLRGLGFRERAEKVVDALVEPEDRELARLVVTQPLGIEVAQLEAMLARSRQDPELAYSCLLGIVPTRAPTAVELAPLNAAARAGLAATRAHFTEGQDAWATIAALEPELAQARSHEVAFEQALYYRALWRLALGTPAELAAQASQALQLCDELVALNPQDRYYLLRMTAVEREARPHAMVETARSVLDLIERSPSMPPAHRQALGGELRAALGRAQLLPGAPIARARQLLARLEELMAR